MNLFQIFSLTGAVNIATFNEFNMKEGEKENSYTIWEDYHTGVGLSVGYLSPIGPIEFSVSHNDDLDEILY